MSESLKVTDAMRARLLATVSAEDAAFIGQVVAENERLRIANENNLAGWADDRAGLERRELALRARYDELVEAARMLCIGADVPHILSGREPSVDRDDLARLRTLLEDTPDG